MLIYFLVYTNKQRAIVAQFNPIDALYDLSIRCSEFDPSPCVE